MGGQNLAYIDHTEMNELKIHVPSGTFFRLMDGEAEGKILVTKVSPGEYESGNSPQFTADSWQLIYQSGGTLRLTIREGDQVLEDHDGLEGVEFKF